MEPESIIPLGTFIEFTWHSIESEPDDVWDDYAGPTESARLVGVVAEESVSSTVVLCDTGWEPPHSSKP